MIPTQQTEVVMEDIAYLHKDANSDTGVSFPDFRVACRPARSWTNPGVWRQKPWIFISRD